MSTDEREELGKVLYNFAISEPGCITAATWERAEKGVRAHHCAKADAILAAGYRKVKGGAARRWTVAEIDRAKALGMLDYSLLNDVSLAIGDVEWLRSFIDSIASGAGALWPDEIP